MFLWWIEIKSELRELIEICKKKIKLINEWI